MAGSPPLHFTVAFKGAAHPVELPGGSTLAALADRLAQECSVAPETIKLLAPGKAGMIKPAQQPQRSLQDAGITPGMKLKLLASASAEVAALQRSRDLPGLAPLEHELRREVARAGAGGGSAAAGAPPAPTSPYTFAALQPWQRPGLSPPPSEALKLLRRLAADAGIAGVMARHRWRVGLLSEMPPEGRVGVSPVCILGVNINAGQEISLRLRTDDLKGFRRYDRIRETLIHELAHMVHSEHDDAFKTLNSQLRREAAELDWRGSPAVRALEGAAYAGVVQYDLPPAERDVMGQTAQLSGRSLRELAEPEGPGRAAAGTAVAAQLGPKAAAAQAAVQRAAGAAAAAAGEEGLRGATPPVSLPQPPRGQLPPLPVAAGVAATVAAQRERPGRLLRKGDLAWYRQGDGSWVPTQVVHVDTSVQPPSYGISLGAGEGSEGSYRETEAHRLLPREEGEAGPAGAGGAEVPVEGLGHCDGSTEAKEEEVRRRLEE